MIARPLRRHRQRPLQILSTSVSVLLAGAALFNPSPATAVSLTWDGSDATLNGNYGGSGTWDLVTMNWTDIEANSQVPWTSNFDIASFRGTPGAVTLNTPLGVQGLQFLTAGYTLSGSGVLEIGSDGIDASTLGSGATGINVATFLTSNQAWKVGTGSSLVIGGDVSGNVQLTKQGGGTLSLNGGGTVASLQVNDGTLAINSTVNVTGGPGTFVFIGNGGNNGGTPNAFARLSIGMSGTLNITGELNDNMVIGRDGGSGVITQTGGTVSYNPSNRSQLFVGATGNSATNAVYDLQGGTLNMNGKSLTINLAAGTNVTSTGIFRQSGGAVNNASELKLGDNNGNTAATATYSISGGSYNLLGAPANVYNGTSGSGTAIINIDALGIATGTSASPVANGINFDAANGNQQIGTATGRITNFNVGHNASGSFSLVQGVTLRTVDLRLGNGSSDGVFNLNGGILNITGSIAKGAAATGQLNLNGGTLQAGGSLPNFISANVGTFIKAGGATVDTNGFNAVIAASLAEDVGSPGGGLTKVGSGTLTLSGTNSYTGTTRIDAGTLRISSLANLGAASNSLMFNGGGLQVTGTTMNGFGSHAVSFVASKTVSLDIADAANVFTAAQVFDQTSGGLNKFGQGTLVLTGSSTYTGATTVAGGTLVLDFSGSNTGASRLNSTSGLVLNGTTFRMIGTNVAGQTSSQTLAGLTLNPGASNISNVSAGSGLNSTLNLGGLSRTGGSVDFTLPAAGSITTTATNTNGILGYATVGGNTWAVGSTTGAPTPIQGLATYVFASNAGNSAAIYLNADIDVDASQTPLAAIAPNSLRFNSSVGTTLNLTGANTITAGGILVTSAKGANASTITGGTLAGASGRDLVIIQNNLAGTLEISSGIVDNGTATGLTKSGPGQLILSNPFNSYTGKTYLNGGITRIVDDTSLGAVPGNVTTDQLTFNGGTLQMGGSFNLAFNRGITLVGTGGTLDTDGHDSSYGGIVAGSGSFVKNGAGTLTLTNNNNSFTGDFIINGGSVVAIGGRNDAAVPASSLGNLTVPGRQIRVNSGATLVFGGNDIIGAANSIQSVELVIDGGTVSRNGDFFISLPNITLLNGGTLTGGNGFNNVNFQSYHLTGSVTVGGGSGSTITTTGTANTSVHLGRNTLFNVLSTGSGPDLTVSAPLANRSVGAGSSGAFTKMGNGTMLLTAANTYSGPTTIAEGALAIQAPGALGAVAAGTSVLSGAALRIQGNISTLAEPLTLNGAGIASGGALQNVSGTNSYTGPITLGSSARINSDVGLLTLNHSGPIQGSGGVLTVGGAGNTAIASVIGAGVGGVTKDGSGTLFLSGTNTYTGQTNVSAGKLVVSGSLNTASQITVGGGATLAGTGTIGSTTVLNGGVIEAGLNGTGQITLSGITFAGSGTLNFGNLADYSASAGIRVLDANSLVAMGGNGSVTINVANLAGVVTGNVYPLISYSGSIQGAGFGAFQLATLPSRTTGALLNNSGTISIQITGTDFLKWTGGANLANGWDTTTANWKLNSNNSSTTFIDTTDAVMFDDSALQSATNVQISAANVNPSVVTFNNSSRSYTLSGTKGIASGAVIKNGMGAVTITNSNSYSGGTTLENGTLILNNPSAIGTGTLKITGGALDNTTGAPLSLAMNNSQIWAGDFSFTGTNDLNLGTGTVSLTGNSTIRVNAGNLTVGGAIEGNGFTVAKAGGGTLTLTGGSTFNGGVILTAGTLNINNAAALGTGTFTLSGGSIDNTSGTALTLANNNSQVWSGDFTFAGTNNLNLGSGAVTLTATPKVSVNSGNLTVGGVISGADFGFTKSGAGTLTLTANNRYSGVTTVQQGTLVVSGGGSFYNAGTEPGQISVQNGGTLLFDRTDTFGQAFSNSPVVISVESGGTVTNTPGRFNSLNNSVLNGGTIVAQAGIPTGGAFNLQGFVTVGGTVPSAITSGGGANAHISIGRENNSESTVFVVENVTGDANPDLIADVVLGNNFNSASGLMKQGSGTMVLAQTNTYTGETYIVDGTLLVSGSIGGSTVTVDGPTAVLGGNGSVGALTAATGGTVAPGMEIPGMLDTGSLALLGGAVLKIDVVAPLTYDALNVAGTVTLDNAILSLFGDYRANPGIRDIFFIIINDGGVEDPVNGRFTGLGEGARTFSISGQEYMITYFADADTSSITGGNDIALIAVPEPSAVLLTMSGLGVLLGMRRRKSSTGSASN